jgi:hypothetical protein
MPGTPRSSTPFLLLGLAWLAIVMAAAGTGRLATLAPPRPQLLIVVLTVALVLAGMLIPSFRDWLATLPLRALVALHIVRFVGIYFLILAGRGTLPAAFALPAGIGDIVVATGALILVLLVPALNQRGRLVAGWNLLGLLDILFVVGTAARLAMADPPSMVVLLRLPLSVIPTFLVPLIIGSHLLILRRIRQTTV